MLSNNGALSSNTYCKRYEYNVLNYSNETVDKIRDNDGNGSTVKQNTDVAT